MEKIKKRWEIDQNWQLLFPLLGAASCLYTGYAITRKLLHAFELNNTAFEWPFTIVVCIALYWALVRFFLWCFKKLENKWKVDQKWEMIAIFIVFAITGSLSAKLAQPFVEWIGLGKDTTNSVLYWTARIVLIFPLYQVLLVLIGWIFGQFHFFWSFEKKMLKRMGLGFLIK